MPEMTLDEAITHHGEMATECEDIGHEEGHADHKCLATWLAELRTLREARINLRAQLEAVKAELHHLKSPALNPSPDVAVQVLVAQNGKGVKEGVTISSYVFDQNLPPIPAPPGSIGFCGDDGVEFKTNLIRQAIEEAGVRAAQEFIYKTQTGGKGVYSW